MNKIIFIAMAILILTLVGGITYLVVNRGATQLENDSEFGVQIPSQPGADEVDTRFNQDLVTIRGINREIVIYNFVNNPETVRDPMNPSDYIIHGDLGYCVAGGSCETANSEKDFSIVYNRDADLFSITLNRTPLEATRREAEEFLRQTLIITKEDMCELSHNVFAPYWVSEEHSGKNLKFSYCQGSAPL